MPAIAEIITTIEDRWDCVAVTEITRAITEGALEEVYVAGFWLFYVDYTAFYPPYLCINTENLCQRDRSVGHEYRWASAEWEIGLDEATDTMREDYEVLMEALAGESENIWRDAIEAHYQAIARVCRGLTSKFRESRPQGVAPSFVAGIFEERESEDEFNRLVHMSIEDAILRALPCPTWTVP